MATAEFGVTFPTNGVIEKASKAESESSAFSVEAPEFLITEVDQGDAERPAVEEEAEDSIPMSMRDPTIAAGIVRPVIAAVVVVFSLSFVLVSRDTV